MKPFSIRGHHFPEFRVHSDSRVDDSFKDLIMSMVSCCLGACLSPKTRLTIGMQSVITISISKWDFHSPSEEALRIQAIASLWLVKVSSTFPSQLCDSKGLARALYNVCSSSFLSPPNLPGIWLLGIPHIEYAMSVPVMGDSSNLLKLAAIGHNGSVQQAEMYLCG